MGTKVNGLASESGLGVRCAMPRRILTKDRCTRCYMRLEVCLCPIIPSWNLATKLVVLMHAREVKATTNTGRLALLALEKSEMRVRGAKDNPMDGSNMAAEGSQPLFLFPGDEATTLTPEFLAGYTKPFTLIVPDGTWRQASKMGRRVPELVGIPWVKLAPGKPTGYKLRRAPQSHCLSTLEAIARALGVIEGAAVQKSLEDLFHIMVERTLLTRTPDSLTCRMSQASSFQHAG